MSWSSCSTAQGADRPWGVGRHRAGPFPRRSLEIAAIVAGFFVAWPAALTYVVWKLAGYPFLGEMRGYVERWRGGKGGFAFAGFPERGFARSSGNWAFDEYRRGEIERLERERRRLDEERQAFGAFVEELKRAKDREEFDAFMAKRRSGSDGCGNPGPGPVVDA